MMMKLGSYHMEHRAPGREEGAPLHDVTANGVYPSDFYQRYYEYGAGDPLDSEAQSVVLRMRGKPDRWATICRAVPKGIRTINPGDWVSIVKQYARNHGRHVSDPTQDMPVICARAKAKDLHTEGNSLLEWGYNGAAPLKATVAFRPKTREQIERAKETAAARRKKARLDKVFQRSKGWLFGADLKGSTMKIKDINRLLRGDSRKATAAFLNEARKSLKKGDCGKAHYYLHLGPTPKKASRKAWATLRARVERCYVGQRGGHV